jgi:predicted amidophosphoribosyltransferase
LAALSAQRITEEYERRQMEYPSIVIPLPLHWKKLTYRSFNQSQIIARLLTSDIQRLTQKNPESSHRYSRPHGSRPSPTSTGSTQAAAGDQTGV